MGKRIKFAAALLEEDVVVPVAVRVVLPVKLHIVVDVLVPDPLERQRLVPLLEKAKSAGSLVGARVHLDVLAPDFYAHVPVQGRRAAVFAVEAGHGQGAQVGAGVGVDIEGGARLLDLAEPIANCN